MSKKKPEDNSSEHMFAGAVFTVAVLLFGAFGCWACDGYLHNVVRSELQRVIERQ